MKKKKKINKIIKKKTSEAPVVRAECKTPKEMRLANACCRYLELAQELKVEEVRR